MKQVLFDGISIYSSFLYSPDCVSHVAYDDVLIPFYYYGSLQSVI